MKAILKKHPELDFFYGFLGGKEITKKQDKFKQIFGKELYVKVGSEFKKVEDENLYLKKESEAGHKKFEEELKINILEIVKGDSNFPIKNPQKVEAILRISMDEKRLNLVDVDNLTKSILDCMNGLVFEDDSQVLNILARKDINPIAPLNSLMIGVRKIKADSSDSWFKNISLAYFDYEETDK